MASTSDNKATDISILFNHLQGNLSEEQLKTYHELRKSSGNLVTTQQCSDMDNSDEEVSKVDRNRSILLAISKPVDKKAQLSTTYVNGQISLDKFTELLEKESQEDDEDAFDSHNPEAAADFENEFLNMSKSKRGRQRIPKHLQGLMGEANMRLARGDHEEAIKMCMELVRSAPTASEPFQTLGMLYDEIGEHHMSFQFYLIAAYLYPKDIEEWLRLGEIAMEQKNPAQAVKCFSKALKLDPDNDELHQECVNLYVKLGDKKKAIESCVRYLLKAKKPENGEKYLQISRKLATLHHEEGLLNPGITAMKTAIEKYPSDITSEDINLLLELLINQKMYHDVIQVLITHCGVKMVAEDDSEDSLLWNNQRTLDKYQKCILPDVLPIDLRVKLVVSIIHLHGFHIVKEVVEPLNGESIEEMGDLYLDVAESFMDVGEYQEALPYLASLAATEAYNMPGVWLKFAQCLNAIGDIDRAGNAYRMVVRLAPDHLDARISLSTILKQLGYTEEALLTLENPELQKTDLQLLFQKCTLLYSQKMFDEFLIAAKEVVSARMEKLVNETEIGYALAIATLKRRLSIIQDRREEAGETKSYIKEDKYTDTIIPPEKLWDLHQKICEVLFDQKRFAELENWSISTLMSIPFHKELVKGLDLTFSTFLACLYNKSWDHAFILFKSIATTYRNCNRYWNIFSYVANKTQSVRHNKFCIRMSLKNADNIQLSLLNGHCALVAGSYKHALGEYINVFQHLPKEPFIIFCIGLTLTLLTAQKFTDNKSSLVIQAMAFLNQYMEVRGDCQESNYNLGRAMHMLGLNHAAVFYYKNVLALSSDVEGSPEEEDLFNLKREAAFNLSLIYRQSGSLNLAKYLIRKYCQI